MSNSRHLLQQRAKVVFRSGDQTVLHDRARTGVPAQRRIIVFRRTQSFGFFVPVHGFAQAVMRSILRAVYPALELRPGLPLADDAGVVGALVVALQTAEQ